MMKDLMEKFVRKELLSNSISSMMEVDFSDKKNHVENKNINIQGAHSPRKIPFILKIHELTNVTWKPHESGQETGIYGNSLR